MNAPLSPSLLQRVSLTGADDQVDPHALHALAQAYPKVEWALLLFPEKEGHPRNPTQAWRERFLDVCGRGMTALHLCGQAVFDGILMDPDGWLPEWQRYGRVQININARRPTFTDAQIVRIYHTLHDEGLTLILQQHEGTERAIDQFLNGVNSLERLHVLFDGSKGRGTLPDAWTPTKVVRETSLFCGHAGGLSPSTIPEALSNIARAAGDTPYWIDMESGVRTDNAFDLEKARAVLQAVVNAPLLRAA